DIHLYINSPGGSVTAGMAIYDTMHYIPCGVATYCIGLAASMGSTLLAAGTKGKRNALPHAEVMIHQVLGGAQGSAADMLIRTKHLLRTKRLMNEILQRCTGQPLEKVERDTDRDNFMSAQEAKDQGLREVRAELEGTEAYNQQLQRELHHAHVVNGAAPGPEGVPPPPPPARLKAITLGRQTGGLEQDGVPGDEALQVVLEPRDFD